MRGAVTRVLRRQTRALLSPAGLCPQQQGGRCSTLHACCCHIFQRCAVYKLDERVGYVVESNWVRGAPKLVGYEESYGAKSGGQQLLKKRQASTAIA